MNQKKIGFASLAMLVLSLLFGALAVFVEESQFLQTLEQLFGLVLLAGSVVAAYFAFRDTIAIPNKWVWAGIALLSIFARATVIDIFRIVQDFSTVYALIAGVVWLLGAAGILAAVLDSRFFWGFPVGFGALALSVLFRALAVEFTNLYILLELALFVAFALVWVPFLKKFVFFLKVFVILLAVAATTTIGVLGAACWIFFAAVLIRAESRPKFSFHKFTAVLLAIALFAFGAAVVNNGLFERLRSEYEDIRSEEEFLASADEDLSTLEKEYEEALNAYAAASRERARAESALEDAEWNLDDVCWRDEYSPSWSWYYGCDSSCQSLHLEVERCERELEQKEQSENAAENLRDDLLEEVESIRSAKEKAKEKIEEFNRRIASVWLSELTGFVLNLALVAALGCLVFCFWRKNYNKLAVISLVAVVGYWVVCLLQASPLSGFVNAFDSLLMASLASLAWFAVSAALFLGLLLKKDRRPVILRGFVFLSVVPLIVLAIQNLALVSYERSALFFSVFLIAYSLALVFGALALVGVRFVENYSVAKHIFYTIITLGIWQLIWIWNVTKNLNEEGSSKIRKPTQELLLCMFLPFYSWYWIYKTGEFLEAKAAKAGQPFKIATLSFCIYTLFAPVATALLQNKINVLSEQPK